MTDSVSIHFPKRPDDKFLGPPPEYFQFGIFMAWREGARQYAWMHHLRVHCLLPVDQPRTNLFLSGLGLARVRLIR